MSKAALFNLISTDATLHTLGYAASAVYASNAVDDPYTSKFIVIHWEDVLLSVPQRSIGPTNVTVWFHDKERTYDDIDAALNRTKVLMDAVIHLPGSDGFTITQMDWQGDSGELFDDGYGTVTRTTSYRIVSRPS